MTVCAEQHKSYGRQDYMEVSDESESAAQFYSCTVLFFYMLSCVYYQLITPINCMADNV